MASSFTLSSQRLAFLLILIILFSALSSSSARNSAWKSKARTPAPTPTNAIDQCWRPNPKWWSNRAELASCSVGFAGKMHGNAGKGLVHYVVTDHGDDPVKPRPGTLRYGATVLKGKVWITFQRDMHIHLQQPLLVSSHTTVDGRGAVVHIAHGSCILLNKVTDVIIHGIKIHHCKPRPAGLVISPNSQITQMSATDGDGIRMVGCSKIWIDHNELYECFDGLLDVTRGSTNITISNNRFRNHDKVMLLGHDDGYRRDKNMKVTVVYNHFGPDCRQRMPRVRFGYAHVVNNLYKKWEEYAIGGSMNPSILSEANLFIAPKTANKKVTRRQDKHVKGSTWSFQSMNDIFVNGAFVSRSGNKATNPPRYNRQQAFRVGDARKVWLMTKNAGALRCSRRTRC